MYTRLGGADTGALSINIGIHPAWRKADDSTLWRRIVDTATLHHGMTKYRKGPQRTHKRPTKDRKGALRAKLQEIGTN